jgi:hypothetical protein
MHYIWVVAGLNSQSLYLYFYLIYSHFILKKLMYKITTNENTSRSIFHQHERYTKISHKLKSQTLNSTLKFFLQVSTLMLYTHTHTHLLCFFFLDRRFWIYVYSFIFINRYVIGYYRCYLLAIFYNYKFMLCSGKKIMKNLCL